MKTIAYYVTDSGFGHLTRSTAIVAQILKDSHYNVIFICNKEQNNHAKVQLRKYEKRVSFIAADTDANSAFYPHSLKVNIEETEKNIQIYLEELEEIMEDQYNLLKGMEIVLVITDISILGIMVGKKLGVKTVGISNYTWYNRFKGLGIKEEIIASYQAWYNKLDKFYRFEFSDDMTGITCPMEDVGLVCRELNHMASGDLKKSYWPAVYFAVGEVEKGDEVFEVDFPLGTLFMPGRAYVSGNVHCVKLPERVVPTQDYIGASAFALIKGGWSTVAECLIIGIPLGILEQGETEDKELVEKLFNKGYAFRVTEEEVHHFIIRDLNIKAMSLQRPKYENDTPTIAKKMIEEINS